MKDTKSVEFARKHREDVIDTLQLRQKERRVLYGLLLILLMTVTYENSAFFYSALIENSHTLPELGTRRKPQLNHEMLQAVDRALVEAAEDYPQYWARFSDNQKRIDDATRLLSEDGGAGEALELVTKVAISMNEFATHPLIKPGKKIERLAAEIASLVRILKLDIDTAGAELKPLDFSRDAAAGSRQRKRNLFEYCLR